MKKWAKESKEKSENMIKKEKRKVEEEGRGETGEKEMTFGGRAYKERKGREGKQKNKEKENNRRKEGRNG